MRPLPVRNARLRFLDADEVTRLLRAARDDVAALWLVPAIELAVRTGLRQGELLRLRWTDLDAGRRLATILETKNGAPRHVPLSAAAQAIVATLPATGATVLAWPWGDPLSDTTLYYAFQRVCAAAGIADCTWHTLRQTFASHLVMSGVDLRTVQELLGHKTLAMTMRYAHLAPSHVAAAVEKLDAALAPPEAARAVAAAPKLTRFEHAASGQQTPAKRKYVEARRLGEWRRGESNPRPNAPEGDTGSDQECPSAWNSKNQDPHSHQK